MLSRSNKHGCTPLYLAVQNGHANVAQYLIEKEGKNGNQSSNQMLWTPLGVAVDRSDTKLVNILIKAAAETVEKVKIISRDIVSYDIYDSHWMQLNR
jgi:ankyrin repeat protein